ncbi:MAG: hypothetical protein IJQ37_04270, partial [Clostridia bacterium]|nr:hypothetical protein [Clostridia bacterium]
LSQTTEARIGRVQYKIFLLCCFSFSKKEKSDGFNRREAPQGVARGRRDGTDVLFLLVQEKVPKEARKKGYANREGYALIYLDIARLFFFPKRTIRLYFNSRSALKEGFVRT